MNTLLQALQVCKVQEHLPQAPWAQVTVPVLLEQNHGKYWIHVSFFNTV